VENDPVALEDILAPDFLHVVPVGIITEEEHIRFLREHPAPGQHTHKRFEDLHVRIYGDTGIVNGTVIETTDRGERKLLHVRFLRRRSNRQLLPVSTSHPVQTS